MSRLSAVSWRPYCPILPFCSRFCSPAPHPLCTGQSVSSFCCPIPRGSPSCVALPLPILAPLVECGPGSRGSTPGLLICEAFPWRSGSHLPVGDPPSHRGTRPSPPFGSVGSWVFVFIPLFLGVTFFSWVPRAHHWLPQGGTRSFLSAFDGPRDAYRRALLLLRGSLRLGGGPRLLFACLLMVLVFGGNSAA